MEVGAPQNGHTPDLDKLSEAVTTAGEASSMVDPSARRRVPVSKAGLPLEAGFLTKIIASSRDAVSIPLPGGLAAKGVITLTERGETGVCLIQGEITRPEPGKFMFARQSPDGVDGAMIGYVHYFQSETAYQVRPVGVNRSPVLVEVTVDQVVCRGYAAPPDDGPEEIPPTHPENFPIPPEENGVIQLESLPGAPAVVYLDFDGEERNFVDWGYINAAPAGISNSSIYEVWKGISEDFMPFNINITTIRRVYDTATAGSRMHVIFTPTDTAAPGAGGVAYLNSFNSTSQRVCWVFASSTKVQVEARSHEIGHTLRLSHDGRTSPSEGYYSGHNGWGPIMGATYTHTISQWSKGEYPQANNNEDDLLIISSNNNSVAYRADDHGNTHAAASELEISSDKSVANEGVIGRNDDVDAFRFTTSGGPVTIHINNVDFNPNLDIKAEILTAAGAVVATSDPEASADASFISLNLTSGNYFLRVSGTGKGDLVTGYSKYGSLGAYTVTGTVNGGVHSDRFDIVEHPAVGAGVGTVNPRVSHGGGAPAYSITSGNTGSAFSIHPSSGLITVQNPSLLDYETLTSKWDDRPVFVLNVRITDSLGIATENIRTVVTVTDVNEPPVFNMPLAMTLPENPAPGTLIATASATDPDRYDFVTYSITSGNTGSAFAINPQSGAITTSGPLDFSTLPSYTLGIRATDQRSPSNQVTTQLSIQLLNSGKSFMPGSVGQSLFTGISGTTLASLTSHPGFPNSPDVTRALTSFDSGANQTDNYGSTIRAHLIAPATGNYTFWIASDDSSELRIGTNASATTATVRASVSGSTGRYAWTTNASQQSAPLALTAGQAYYIEARHKEGTGEDHVAVAWQGPGFSREVIPGRWLSPFNPVVTVVSPSVHTAYIPSATGIMLEAQTVPPGGQSLNHQWSKISGPGSVVFDSATAHRTGAVFSANGTYVLRFTATANAVSAAKNISVEVGGEPAPPIGGFLYGAGTTGSHQALVNGTYVLQGASSGLDSNSSNDGFYLMGTVFSGDFDLRTRVHSGTNITGTYDERAGLIVRQGTGGAANEVSAFIGFDTTSPEWGYWIRRTSNNGNNSLASYNSNMALPGWCRITRTGNTVAAYHSTDGGVTWLSRGTMTMSGAVRAGLCWSSDSTSSGSVTFSDVSGFPIYNRGPLVSAGPDAGITVDAEHPLVATVSDDGFPSPPGTTGVHWLKISGPGSAWFSQPRLPASNVVINTAGSHVLRITANDGQVETFDDLTLQVVASNRAPVFSENPVIRPNAAAESGYSASLQGTASDADPLDTISFSKTDGPAWLQIGADGSLAGTPGIDRGGINEFNIRATDSAGLFAEAVLRIEVDLTPSQQWRLLQFAAAASDPEIAGDHIDGDRDGWVNLLEYALGTDPETADQPGIDGDFAEIGGNRYLRLTIHRNPAATDLSYMVQVTSDPATPESWSDANTFIEENTPTILRVRDTLGGDRRFMRLLVSRPPG